MIVALKRMLRIRRPDLVPGPEVWDQRRQNARSFLEARLPTIVVLRGLGMDWSSLVSSTERRDWPDLEWSTLRNAYEVFAKRDDPRFLFAEAAFQLYAFTFTRGRAPDRDDAAARILARWTLWNDFPSDTVDCDVIQEVDGYAWLISQNPRVARSLRSRAQLDALVRPFIRGLRGRSYPAGSFSAVLNHFHEEFGVDEFIVRDVIDRLMTQGVGAEPLRTPPSSLNVGSAPHADVVSRAADPPPDRVQAGDEQGFFDEPDEAEGTEPPADGTRIDLSDDGRIPLTAKSAPVLDLS
jgi:hypothetical protein